MKTHTRQGFALIQLFVVMLLIGMIAFSIISWLKKQHVEANLNANLAIPGVIQYEYGDYKDATQDEVMEVISTHVFTSAELQYDENGIATAVILHMSSRDDL